MFLLGHTSVREESKLLIDVRDLCKVYRMGDVEVHALRGVSFTVDKGELIAIMGLIEFIIYFGFFVFNKSIFIYFNRF